MISFSNEIASHMHIANNKIDNLCLLGTKSGGAILFQVLPLDAQDNILAHIAGKPGGHLAGVQLRHEVDGRLERLVSLSNNKISVPIEKNPRALAIDIGRDERTFK